MKSKNSIVPPAGSGSRKTVFIVEDHPVFREGLTEIIHREGDLKVCGEAESAEEALGAIGRLKPDVVLVDLTLPGKGGLDLIKEVRATNSKVKLLVVSMHDQALYADRVLRAGGDGYIMKQEDPAEIVHAIRDILSGRLYVSEEVMGSTRKGVPTRSAETAGRRIDLLTDTELVVLELLGRGKSQGEIASQSGLSVKAVAAACRKMEEKLALQGANMLLRYAVCWVETGAT